MRKLRRNAISDIHNLEWENIFLPAESAIMVVIFVNALLSGKPLIAQDKMTL